MIDDWKSSSAVEKFDGNNLTICDHFFDKEETIKAKTLLVGVVGSISPIIFSPKQSNKKCKHKYIRRGVP